MPALQPFSHFVHKIEPKSTTRFSCKQNHSASHRAFSNGMSSSSAASFHATIDGIEVEDVSVLRKMPLGFDSIARLEAILFDIDGTLCDSDPIHYYAFREMLQDVGFNDGVPITEEFFIKTIAGNHNEELCRVLFPNWDLERGRKFFDEKEAMFRRLAAKEMAPVTGLGKLCRWVENRGLRRAAVTNAPRENAEMLISLLGLDDFFELIIIGSECERAKPFPDPYLKALHVLGLSSEHAFVFEDSAAGINAGVAAGMPVVGLATRNPELFLSEAGATIVIKDYTDSNLWDALEELGNKTTEAAKVAT